MSSHDHRRLDGGPSASAGQVGPDDDSRAWLLRLRAPGATGEQAIADLHGFLIRAARHEAERRRPSLRPEVAADIVELAYQAAGDAAVSILRKLDTYRGESRFTTWAFKFAIVEMSAALRRQAWRDRSIVVDDAAWERIAERSATDPHRLAEFRELVAEVRAFVATDLTPRQREVFGALVVDEVPIDVLAERLHSSRGAIYKTLHDARAKLRTRFAERASGPTHEGSDR